MNTISRTITGTLAIILGLFLTILSLFKELLVLIYGIPILIIGILILFNKKEDNIEGIKTKSREASSFASDKLKINNRGERRSKK